MTALLPASAVSPAGSAHEGGGKQKHMPAETSNTNGFKQTLKSLQAHSGVNEKQASSDPVDRAQQASSQASSQAPLAHETHETAVNNESLENATEENHQAVIVNHDEATTENSPVFVMPAYFEALNTVQEAGLASPQITEAYEGIPASLSLLASGSNTTVGLRQKGLHAVGTQGAVTLSGALSGLPGVMKTEASALGIAETAGLPKSGVGTQAFEMNLSQHFTAGAQKEMSSKHSSVMPSGNGMQLPQGMIGVTLAAHNQALLNSGIAQINLEQGSHLSSSLSVSEPVSTAGYSSVVNLQTPLSQEAKIQLPISMSFGQAGWASMVAERSAMMASQNIPFAELQLDPPELGPLQVKVTVNQDQAAVSFVASNPQVKEALDQTVAKLKELLSEQGMDLVDVDVSDQSSQESDEQEGFGNETPQGELLADEEEPAQNMKVLNVTYGIDHYA